LANLCKSKKVEACADIAQAISKLLPEYLFGWVHLAYSLHEMKRTKEALSTLLPIADKFPNEWVIPYNLACYSCQLGELNEAFRWLERAFAVSGKAEIKTKALEDRDLEPLWKHIGTF
jgi:tetratricopeptide (TPR) repeat protein